MDGAFHFITSHMGEPHITPENDARYNAGTLGSGSYVLPTKSKMACTLVDSNTVRILAGDAVCCGYRWSVKGDYAEVNIDNGVPGYKRIDLVVAHIETYPDFKCEPRVIKGEETTGTPAVPEHISDDLNAGNTVTEQVICSVEFDGINPQEPKMLLAESHTIEGMYADLSKQIKDLRDSQSRLTDNLYFFTGSSQASDVDGMGVLKRYWPTIPNDHWVFGRTSWNTLQGFTFMGFKGDSDWGNFVALRTDGLAFSISNSTTYGWKISQI